MKTIEEQADMRMKLTLIEAEKEVLKAIDEFEKQYSGSDSNYLRKKIKDIFHSKENK